MYAIQEADTVLHGLLHPHQQPREVSSPIAVGGGGGRVSYGGRGDRDSVGGRSPTRASAKSGFGRPKKSDARCVKCFTVKGRGCIGRVRRAMQGVLYMNGMGKVFSRGKHGLCKVCSVVY